MTNPLFKQLEFTIAYTADIAHLQKTFDSGFGIVHQDEH